jgi:hypothetical protein
VTISLYLDDEAADWYGWMSRHSQLAGWRSFTDVMVQRFHVRDLEDPEGLLAKLQQTSTVADYRHRFKELSTRTMPLPPAFLVCCLISGLSSDIKQSMIIHQPKCVYEAMKYA